MDASLILVKLQVTWIVSLPALRFEVDISKLKSTARRETSIKLYDIKYCSILQNCGKINCLMIFQNVNSLYLILKKKIFNFVKFLWNKCLVNRKGLF